MLRTAIVRHRPDWVKQSGPAGSPIGRKAPIGNTDCPIGYGFYPLASAMTSRAARQYGATGTGGLTTEIHDIPSRFRSSSNAADGRIWQAGNRLTGSANKRPVEIDHLHPKSSKLTVCTQHRRSRPSARKIVEIDSLHLKSSKMTVRKIV